MDLYAYQTFRVVYEATSAIFCFILVRFMIKPYLVTRESRYLGLPLGFGFLGATYALSAFVYFQPQFFGSGTIYFQLVMRTFAFVFLCVTYYFSTKSGDSGRFWNTSLALLIIAFLRFVSDSLHSRCYSAELSTYKYLFQILQSNLHCVSLCPHT